MSTIRMAVEGGGRGLLLGGPAAADGLPPGWSSVGLGPAAAPFGGRPVGGEAARLPFRSSAFDGAACDRVLGRCPDPEGLLEELARVVRPGGQLWIREPVAPGDPARREREGRREKGRDPRGRRALTMAELSAHVAGELLGVEAHQVIVGDAGDGPALAVWLLRVEP